MRLGRMLTVMLSIVSILSLPLQDVPTPHDRMYGVSPRAGTDAAHPRKDTMADIVECDGEPGARSEHVDVWPSPGPIPSTSPLPTLKQILIVPINLTSNSTGNVTQPKAPLREQPQKTCEDDKLFTDSKGFSCWDYTMNKELCNVADRYINNLGKSARHACCKCGGGTHVLPTPTKKCVRPPMGGEDGCVEEKYATLRVREESSPVLGADDLDVDMTRKMGGGTAYDEVVAEDQIEENALESLGSVSSMDGVLEPDAIVFRDRNFIGYPREPESSPSKDQESFASNYGLHQQYSTIAYTVQPHETFISIAKKFNVSPSLLAAFNEDVADPAVLQVGDILLIPVPRIVEVKEVFPLESPLEGGSDVIVKGSGFVHPAFCKFGDRVAAAKFVVDDTLTCTTPEQKEPGFYPFSVSDGKGSYFPTNIKVHYHVGMVPFCDEPHAKPTWCRPRLSIYSVLPTRVPQDTPTILQFVGAGFNASTVCVVGGTALETTVWSRSNITCLMPASAPGVYSVQVAQGDLRAVTRNEIVVYSTLNVVSIDPRNGPEQGGNAVVVTGTTFKSGAFCRFGEVLVPGIVSNDSVMTCIAPMGQPRVVQLDVSNDGKYFSPSSVPYEYTYLKLDSISQTEGRVSGGEIIQFNGYGFYPNMFCRFGNNITAAEYVNLTTVRCKSPPQSVTAVVRVAVSLDGLRQWTESDVFFHYFTELNEIRPKEGRTIGGDDVHLFGRGFDKFSGYTCRFGSFSVTATVVSESQIQCTSPPGVGTVSFVLESSNRRYKLNAVGQQLTFTYKGTPEIGIFGIFPDHADVRTANVTTILRGSGFTKGTLCRFGDKTSLSVFIDSSTIKCNVPMRDLAELVAVFVSHDGGNSWSGTLGYFEYRAVVTYLDKPIGFVHGGEVVRVSGYGFNYRVSLCVFGNQVTQANVTSQYELTCIAPSSAAAVKVPFAVTSNTSIMYDPYLEFQFKSPGSTKWGTFYVYSEYPSYYVASVVPREVTTIGGMEVLVYGEGFDQTTHCVFGDITLKAEFLDAATIRCITPPHSPGDVEFKVVIFNQTVGYNVTSLGTGLTFAPPVLDKIEPSEGYVTGGQLVTISGRFFTGAISCRIGKFMVPAKVVSDSQVQCVTPAVEVTSIAPVQLVYGTSGSSTGDIVFVYHPVVTSMTPLAGFILTKKQDVIFRGEGFAGDPTQCVFEGSEFVPATIVSNNEIRCSVPLRNVPHLSSVWLTNSRQSKLGSRIFNFKFNPVIQNLHPTVGSTSGGATVVAVGSGFSSVTHCSFDSELVKAVVISDLMVRCQSPYHTPGIVALKLVSQTGVEDTTFVSNPSEFTYKILSTHVTSVFPTAGSIGGGSLVTVRGSGFTLGAFCRFGEIEVPAVYYSPDHIACYSPPSKEPRTVAVEVSQIGNGEGYSQDSHSFTYHSNVSTVNRIDPDYGSEGDEIVVTGYDFSENSLCFFGGSKAVTTFISESQLKCRVPRIGAKAQEIVQVTSDPSQLPGGHVIFHYTLSQSVSDTPAVRVLSPNEGPSTGGTLVVVSGVNFPKSSLCRFGDLYVQAQFISSSEVQCVSPQHRAATVVVEVVSADKQLFSSSFIRFTYRSDSELPVDDLLDAAAPGEPVVEKVSPTSARPGEDISLIGQMFSSVGFCVFRGGDAIQSVPATVVDSANVKCEVPQPLPGLGPSVSVQYVSINGLSSHSLPFRFVE